MIYSPGLKHTITFPSRQMNGTILRRCVLIHPVGGAVWKSGTSITLNFYNHFIVGWHLNGRGIVSRLHVMVTKGFFIWSRLTGIARLPRSRLTPISFVKYSMWSYEKAGQPGYRDLGFYSRDLGNRDENFPIWTLHPGYQDEKKFKYNHTFPWSNVQFLIITTPFLDFLVQNNFF